MMLSSAEPSVLPLSVELVLHVLLLYLLLLLCLLGTRLCKQEEAAAGFLETALWLTTRPLAHQC